MAQDKLNKKAGAKVVDMRPKEDDAPDEAQTVLQQAATAEKNDDLELAEKLYKKQMKQKAFNAFVYTRLMIIYRKQKKYQEELEIINKGIQHFKEHQEKHSASKTSNAAIKKLSNSLNKSLGLTDKKGNFLYEPEPLPAWKKRKATVEKKLKQPGK
jgi:tetratricopeptide (TPR) repeat protein